ncbi:MAG TPA: hypothetical protein DHW42_02270 [Candidatus Marinimicrobia bacterium]|nr:hypothetical protein [Candidatus Neomarinimicrobiota bacterium]
MQKQTNKYLLFLSILLSINRINAQYPVYDFDPVVVTSSRIPTALSNTMRAITVLNREMISASGAQSVEALLEGAAGIDVQSRGPLGVQSDISIRGAGFEQTLILIDGVKLSDPQTAHHNMNLPVSLNDIEQIEILRGGGSKLYGPNAFGGVINIITRKILIPETRIQISGGSHSLYEGSAALSLPVKNITNQLSINKKHSDGYRHNTDFDNLNLFYKSTLKTGTSDFSLSSGYTEKDFGANGFYSLSYPNQREDTKTLFVDTRAVLHRNWGQISTGLNWRRHNDHYLLNFEHPEWYENTHRTNVIQADVQTTIQMKQFAHNIGIELGHDDINSNNLGNHRRQRGGVFYETRLNSSSKLDAMIGAATYYYSDWGWNFSPGIDVGYRLTDHLRWTASLGKAFRVPTFTELFYTSPASLGNPALKPENALTVEQNLLWNTPNLHSSIGVFYRKGTDLIDWVKTEDAEPWQALNIAEIQTAGFESELSVKPASSVLNSVIHRLSISYNYIYNSKSTAAYTSAYLLNNLRNQVVASVVPVDVLGAHQRWQIRYEDRLNQTSHIIVDAHFSRNFGKVELYLNVANIFNIDYADFSGLPMPGRWTTIGISYSLAPKSRIP